MHFEQTWRWFGPNDPISLKEIKQTGVTGIVTALHHIPVGDVWSVDEILKRKSLVEAEGFRWSVVESLPVHEDIKKRSGNYLKYIENYTDSLRNIGTAGIDIVCYNFMPVLDWSRTDLTVIYKDGSITTKFETRAFAAFDLFILKRPSAENTYTAAQKKTAKEYFDGLNDVQKKNLTETVLLGLPGSLEAMTLEQFRAALKQYETIDHDTLQENLRLFLKAVVPAAETADVYLAVHADDPPWSLLGLPRVVSTSEDVEHILNTVDSPHNGLTLCTGSFGAGAGNDLVAMARRFAPRISFMHFRNVWRNADGDFLEENHLDGDIDLYGVLKELVLEQKRRIENGRKDSRMPFRPDHGHLMLPDMDRKGIYPGYSLFGRMRGLAEVRGLELGVRRGLGE